MSASLLVNASLVARHASAGDNAYTGNRPAEVMIGFEIRVPRIGSWLLARSSPPGGDV
jgi:hypothetical protein